MQREQTLAMPKAWDLSGSLRSGPAAQTGSIRFRLTAAPGHQETLRKSLLSRRSIQGPLQTTHSFGATRFPRPNFGSDCGPSDQQAIRQLRARLRLMGCGSERPSGYIHLTCHRTTQSRIAVIDFALLKQLVTSIFVIQPQSADSSMRGSAQRPLLDTTPHQRA